MSLIDGDVVDIGADEIALRAVARATSGRTRTTPSVPDARAAVHRPHQRQPRERLGRRRSRTGPSRATGRTPRRTRRSRGQRALRDDRRPADRARADSSAEAQAQLAWIEQDLAAANADRADHPFIVVISHRGMFSTSLHATDPDVLATRASLAPLYDKYKVDLVVNGHDHEYERTYPISRCTHGSPPNGAAVAGTGDDLRHQRRRRRGPVRGQQSGDDSVVNALTAGARRPAHRHAEHAPTSARTRFLQIAPTPAHADGLRPEGLRVDAAGRHVIDTRACCRAPVRSRHRGPCDPSLAALFARRVAALAIATAPRRRASRPAPGAPVARRPAPPPPRRLPLPRRPRRRAPRVEHSRRSRHLRERGHPLRRGVRARAARHRRLDGRRSAAEASSLVIGKWATTLYGFLEGDTIYDSTQSFTERPGNAQVLRRAGRPRPTSRTSPGCPGHRAAGSADAGLPRQPRADALQRPQLAPRPPPARARHRDGAHERACSRWTSSATSRAA